MTTPAIGPVVYATLFSQDASASAAAWCDYLHQHIHSQATLSAAEAAGLGQPSLSGAQVIWLANELDEAWLRIVHVPQAQAREAFKYYGWLSLEISVEDVDALRPSLENSPFKIIGEPANLDVSDDIRAMQCVGPDGEVLYLTEIKAPVPPFELPFARCTVDRLFIPVCMVPDRSEGLAIYQQFEHTTGLSFDTKITVINHALGFEITHKHPVATVQLAGKNLVELDQVNGLTPLPSDQLVSGIAQMSFEVADLPAQLSVATIENGPYKNRQCASLPGAGDSWMELILG